MSHSDIGSIEEPKKIVSAGNDRQTVDDDYWIDLAQLLHWRKAPRKTGIGVFEDDLGPGWYRDGTLNITESCLDRHLATKGGHPAIIWQSNDPALSRTLTYRELFADVCRMAHVLEKFGVKAGDRVVIYMPSTIEAVVGMLACARIGAVHVVLFGGLSAPTVATRIADCQPEVILTVSQAERGGKTLDFKATLDAALATISDCPVRTVLLLDETGERAQAQRDSSAARQELNYEAVAQGMSDRIEARIVAATHPLFILYTSGTTGKPEGILHAGGGYGVWSLFTFQSVFGIRPDDRFWSTADLGWITGHTYGVYAPLLAGVTTVLYEGAPSHPHPGRWWEIIETFKVSVLYTAPTAIRMFAREGLRPRERNDLSSLRLLGSVGEPLDPETWHWYHKAIGNGACRIADTWWQTEAGGILVAPSPEDEPQLPGFAGRPLRGVRLELIDMDTHQKLPAQEGDHIGAVCLAAGWPGQAMGAWRNEEGFVKSHLTRYPGYYFTGDKAYRSPDGQLRFLGRVDDVINVSGHRLSSGEVEAAALTDDRVAECAAVGIPHPVKGQCIVLFAVLHEGVSHEIGAELQTLVSKIIGRFAAPERVWIVDELPQTRSGKVIRRILRAVAAGETLEIDMSTIANPHVVSDIQKICQTG